MVKYNDIWNKIKKTSAIKFHSKTAYNEKYIRTKVKTFNGVVNTISWCRKILKERIHYTYITVICIDSVVKKNKKNYPRMYLEECRYETNKKKMVKFNDVELDLDDSHDSISE